MASEVWRKTHGKWKIEHCGAPYCAFCGGELPYTHDSNTGYFVYPFCPYCGSPMETEFKEVSNWWDFETGEEE